MDTQSRHTLSGTDDSNWQTPRKDLTSVMVWGTGHFLAALILHSSVQTLSLDTT